MKNLDKILGGLSEADKKKIAQVEANKKVKEEEATALKTKKEKIQKELEDLRAEYTTQEKEIRQLRELIMALPDDEDTESGEEKIIKIEPEVTTKNTPTETGDLEVSETAKKETNSYIETMIADIERRRKEELNKEDDPEAYSLLEMQQMYKERVQEIKEDIEQLKNDVAITLEPFSPKNYYFKVANKNETEDILNLPTSWRYTTFIALARDGITDTDGKLLKSKDELSKYGKEEILRQLIWKLNSEELALGGVEKEIDIINDKYDAEIAELKAGIVSGQENQTKEKTESETTNTNTPTETGDLEVGSGVVQNQEIPKEILDLFDDYEKNPGIIDRAELEQDKAKIVTALTNKNIEITKISAAVGDIHTLYEISLAPGSKISKIRENEDELSINLGGNARFILPIPGKGTIGIEVTHRNKNEVSFKEVLEKSQGKASDFLPGTKIRLGKEVNGEVSIPNLTKLPHLLVAGMTGQGKNEIINTALSSLILDAKPSELKLVLMDYQKVEFYPFSELHPNYIAMKNKEGGNIISDTSEVIENLNKLCIEMDDRYDLLKKYKCKNWKEYNEKIEKGEIQGEKKLNMIVLTINEIADYIMTAGKEVELPIARLAQLGRAIGIHVIIGTNRPSENILTGIIRANFPARIGTKVSSKEHSKLIIDERGAEALAGQGDMIFAIGSSSVRLAGGFIKDGELEKLIKFKNQELKKLGLDEIEEDKQYPSNDEEVENKESIKFSELDEKFEEVAKIIVENQSGSTSLIQRKMQFGYNRAGRIMDQLEQMGIVGPAQGSRPREVLFYSLQELEDYIKLLKNR